MFFLLTIALVAKGVLLSVGGPQQLYDMQRFLSARNPRDASKAGMLWGVAMTPMFMVSAAVGVIGLVKWGGNLAHPEDLYPVVIGTMLPAGIKGLVLAGLLSAFMSTFASTVNAGASYLVRDGYQHFLRPQAGSRELIHASRACSALVIIAGILVGMQARNINVIFEWIMMILCTAVLMPNVLRWFWWRFNGTGFAVGTLAGVAASLAAALWFSRSPLHLTFPVLLAISTGTSVLASLVTPATDTPTLHAFYRRIRPAGWWGPVKQAVLDETADLPRDTFGMDVLTAIIGGIGLQALFLTSTYATTHQWRALFVALSVAAACAVLLYFTWYKHLPDENEGSVTV
jgi:Na+/proline symporter